MKSELLQMISDCMNELSDIENRINSLPAMDKGKLYLANHALIRTCGTAEYVMKSLLADHFLQYHSRQLDAFMDQSIRNASDSAKYDNSA